jgi:hypothetical protein
MAVRYSANPGLVNRTRPSHYDAAHSPTDSLIVASVLAVNTGSALSGFRRRINKHSYHLFDFYWDSPPVPAGKFTLAARAPAANAAPMIVA